MGGGGGVGSEAGVEIKIKIKSKIKVNGSGRGRPLYTFFVYPCFFLGRFNRGKPQLLADSRAPKRITASMLERPWGDQ